MNELNENGERHGYWEYGNYKLNYRNGLLHGKYENYWDRKCKDILCRGNHNMNERTNLWEWYEMDGKTVNTKIFFL